MRMCLDKRLQSQPTVLTLMKSCIILLATHGWERHSGSSFGHEPLSFVVDRYSLPLREGGANASVIQEEWDDVVSYAKDYLELTTQDYKAVWWKIYRCIDAKKCRNILVDIEILFCISVFNGRVERLFSQLKLVKTDKKISLSNDSLDSLLQINVEGPPLEQWDPTEAVNSWWKEKSRRTGGAEFHAISSKVAATSTEEDINVQPLGRFLEEWEAWLESLNDPDVDEPRHR